jgi:hypothetical protein
LFNLLRIYQSGKIKPFLSVYVSPTESDASWIGLNLRATFEQVGKSKADAFRFNSTGVAVWVALLSTSYASGYND